jgi:hypothetical protein
MQRLVLTAEQTKNLSTMSGQVEIVNSFGHAIGEFTLNDPSATETHVLSPELIAEMRRIDRESKIGESKTAPGQAQKNRQVRDKA